MQAEPPDFDDAFRARLRELFLWRRDVRRFRTDALPPGAVDRLIETACAAPSVGLSQPWRFVLVDDPGRRAAIRAVYQGCNEAALASYAGPDAERYARLKLAGLDDAPCQIAAFVDRETDIGRGLGRRTMPETADYSVVAAISMMWLAARAEGIGLGWVSIVDPARLAEILAVPAGWRLIGYFCLGYPASDSDTPELERAGWEHRRPAAEMVLRR